MALDTRYGLPVSVHVVSVAMAPDTVVCAHACDVPNGPGSRKRSAHNARNTREPLCFGVTKGSARNITESRPIFFPFVQQDRLKQNFALRCFFPLFAYQKKLRRTVIFCSRS